MWGAGASAQAASLGWELGLSVQGWPWGSQQSAVSTAVVGQGGGEVREGERDSILPPTIRRGAAMQGSVWSALSACVGATAALLSTRGSVYVECNGCARVQCVCMLPCPLQGHGSQSAHSAPRPPEGDSWALWEHDVLMLPSRLPQICSNVLDHPYPEPPPPPFLQALSRCCVCG